MELFLKTQNETGSADAPVPFHGDPCTGLCFRALASAVEGPDID